MEPTIKPGVQYTIAEDKRIELSGLEFSALFTLFEGLVNNPEWQNSAFKVKDTMNILNIRQLLTGKLREAITSGVAIEQVSE